MKKRIVSWLMTLVMVLGLLPTQVWAEMTYDTTEDTTPQSATLAADEGVAPLAVTVSTVKEISTAEEFAAMDPSGNYKLTKDITITAPYSSMFKGTFDGDGHTVTLNVTLKSNGNAGLFGKTGSGAVIKNVAVVADVTSSYASTSYGTAGLIGNVYGATTVENCAVSGTVKNTFASSSGVYVGGIVGFLQDALTIKNCYSTADVSSSSTDTSTKTGGIIGGMSSAYSLTAENCYCSGDVTAAKGYAGGFIGYFNTSTYSNKTHAYTNCFSAGTVKVTGATSNAYGFAYSYVSSGFTFTDCFFNNANSKGFNKTASGISAKSVAELKTIDLGDAFVTGSDGYPILEWQVPIDPNATYTVTFDVTPKDSVLTWNGTEQPVSENGQYTFSVRVGDGEQNYTVSNEAGDYASKTGTVSVKNKDVSVPVELELNEHKLTFTGLPEDAELVVKGGDGEIDANSDGSYSVVNGTYNYTAKAFGYQDTTGSVTINRTDKEETVTMALAAGARVTFENADKGALTVKAQISYWETKEMTGTNGVYNLPFGYKYTWTFTSDNYIDQSGTYEEKSSETTATITIPLKAKPTKNEDGYYQIENADQLAWLAQEVNAGRGANYNAVLTKDIDLGGKNWTPIGKNSSYAYKGTFDGQGYEVKNLSIIGSASNNYGLFGYVNGGTVKNLTVSGEVKITGSGSNSYGIAGIVGYLTGSSAVVENCQNSVSVTGTKNVGGAVGYAANGCGVVNTHNSGTVSGSGEIVGGIVGYLTGSSSVKACFNGATVSGTNNIGGIVGQSNSSKIITGSVNIGSITGNNSVGGIVGQLSSAGSVVDCYNRETVTAKVSKAGGIAGYLNASLSSYTNSVSNCYSTGEVTGSTDSAAVVGKIEKTQYSTVTNCYYLSETSGTSNGATAKTAAELKALASTLGTNFAADVVNDSVNDGYPILLWQLPNVATFTVTPHDTKIVIDGKTGTQSGNKWTFNLPDGTYTYTASAFGHKDKTGTITVTDDVDVTVQLDEADKFGVTFNVATSGAAVAVTWSGDGRTFDPTSGYYYQLPNGTYNYTVKLAGYKTATGEFTVNSEARTVNVAALVEGWDGTTTNQPSNGDGTAESPYQIKYADQLAWLAKKVNEAATVTTIYAKLIDNIDLGNNAFTPIGKEFHEFSGTFDGNGHTITGLKVENQTYAGLFGVVKDATIKNVIVKGTVSGTSDAGGIVGFAKSGTVTIENCGNEAEVTSSGSYAGGVLGRTFTAVAIEKSYNSGDITSAERAGGIAGFAGGSNGSIKITNCYNIGTITSSDYAAGIYSGSSNFVSKCYNGGSVTGDGAEKTGEITSTANNTQTDCFYLAGKNTGTNKDTKAVGRSALQAEVLKKLGTDNWKLFRGVNNTMPLLKWQPDYTEADTGEANLSQLVLFTPEKDAYTLAGDAIYLPSTELTWESVEGADSYVITLYRAERGTDESITLSWAADYYNITGTAPSAGTGGTPGGTLDTTFTGGLDGTYTGDLAYDCTAIFDGLDEGVYFAAVSAVKNGQVLLPGRDNVDTLYLSVQPYNRMKAVTGLKWDGTVAKWDGRSDFTSNEAYQIDIFLLNGDKYSPFTSDWVDGDCTSADLGNIFAVGKQYAFRITAMVSGSADATWLTDSHPSALSPIYTPSEEGESGGSTGQPAEKEWVKISSAEEWLELANVEDEPSAGTGSPSKQQIAWSKNYKLTADIDFSGLSAADQMKTKSIGTHNNPFMGEFDGGGHKITGLTLSNYDSGLFWYVGATGKIHDLTIENANVLFSDNAAVLVHNNRGTIENCAVLNTNITADTGAVLGGMVSRNYGIIRNSYVQGGTLTSNTTTATGHAGFAGSNEEGALIEKCWTSMTVTTGSDYAGGFVGLGYGGTIKDCFALGNVTARGYSGGFVGRSVYSGNTYENCYAAGTVTVTSGVEGNGFIGGNKPDSSFQVEQSEGINNCYYNSAVSGKPYGAKAKSLTEMESGFAALLGTAWEQSPDKNSGLPYLTGVDAPESASTTKITVEIAIATYDKTSYGFSRMGEPITLTMDSNGNTRVVDVMDAAQKQGKLTYSYATTSTFGRFIHTINGHAVNEPDGWMFTINDTLSNVSASLATVKNGDKLLWFEGTTENHFQGPAWEELSNPTAQWVDISTVEQLRELANAVSKEVLGKNYRLTADLDLKNVEFTGIGSAGAPFTGKFDGQYHTIKNVTINKSSGTGVGFFNVIKGATITNLTLENVTVTGDKNVGGLVGHAQVQLDKNDLSKNIANLIGNCAVSGIVTGSVSVGGLVGWNDGTTDSDTGFSVASSINNSRADVTVTGTGEGSDANNKIGGLVGDNAGAITGSSATGAVSGENMVGGLAGYSTGSVYDSHAEVEVDGDANVGGFVGLLSNSGTIKRCYSLGDVFGSDRTGGFAGTITGTVDTAMSAGEVTSGSARMRSVGGYIGGFVGYLEGKLVGTANQITVKNVYGYCGNDLPPVGYTREQNTAAQVDALTVMTLPTMPAVSTTIYDLFRVYLPVIQSGLDGFRDGAVPYGTAKNTTITLGTVPEGMTVEYTVLTTNDYVAAAADGKSLKLVKQNKVTAPVSIEVKVKLTNDADDACGEKTVTVRLLAQYTDLLHKLAQGYQNTTDRWAAMDMMAYGKLRTAQYGLTADAKQNIINLLIGDVTKAKPSVSDYSRAEIVLRSLGIDSTRLSPANSEAVINNAATLQGMAGLTTEWAYGAPLWGMLAALQGNVKLTNAQVTAILGLIRENMGDSGLFAYTYQGVSYPSPDTAATALAALQPYVATNSTARTLANTIYNGLKNYFAANGTFGNANSDAMVIIGLIAAGENPYEMKDGNGKTVVDALLSWVNDDADGFVFYGATNEMATEQGFRALVALEQFNTNGHKAYNVYDFSANRVVAGQATGTGTTGEPEEPEETDEITVSVTISAPNGTWLSKSVTVKKGSTVYHAFVKALEGSGIAQSGAASGYVRSMTKDGVKYGEFTHGENSGWLYMVNGMLPTVGLTSYHIDDGDSIYWYYTVDWTKDPAASAILEEEVTAEDVIKLIDAIGTVTLDSGDAINAARMAYNKLSAEEKAKVTNYDVLLAAEAAYAELLLAEKEKETAATDWQTPYKRALDEAAKRELAFGDEWLAIALARSGKTVPEGYYDSILKAVQAAEGNLSDTKYTEYSRTILALTALGKNPADVGGYDLLSKLADMDKVTYQGINGAIFALIALDSGHYEVPAAPEGTTQTSREALVAYLLDAELPEGGWTLSGSTADVDITAMVLQALANYQSEEEVRSAVERGLNTLSALQLADGGFGSWGTVNSESCAQVIIALTALGIDPATDSRFLKHGFSPLDALCAFYTEGGFRHSKDGAVDAMATEQALCALTAYYRFTNHLSALYDMADTAAAAAPAQPTVPVEEEEGETSVVVWIAVGVAAVGAAGGLLAVRRRKRD